MIDYTFTVTNTGNVTIDDITVIDPTLDAPAVCVDTSLAPGDVTTCSGTYTVGAADLAGGRFVNSASASGSSISGATSAGISSAVVPVVDPPPTTTTTTTTTTTLPDPTTTLPLPTTTAPVPPLTTVPAALPPTGGGRTGLPWALATAIVGLLLIGLTRRRSADRPSAPTG